MPDVTLTVPFAYRAEVVRPKKRNPVPVHYLSEVTVTLRRVDPADAPVAFRCHLPATRIDGPIDHRWHEDGLLRPVHTSEFSGDPETHRDLAWLRERHAVPRPTGPLGAGVERYEYGFHAETTAGADPAGGRIASSTEEEVAAAIRDKAARLLVVGDALWRPAPEPVLTWRWFDRCLHHECVVTDDLGGEDTYRLDQHDRMVLLAPSRAARLHEFNAPPEVLMPGVLRRRVTEAVLHRTMDALTQRMGDQVRARDVGYFAAYAALRDRTEGFGEELGGGGPAGVGTACDALRSALEAHAAAVGDVGDLATRVGRALARVEMDGPGTSHDLADVDLGPRF